MNYKLTHLQKKNSSEQFWAQWKHTFSYYLVKCTQWHLVKCTQYLMIHCWIFPNYLIFLSMFILLGSCINFYVQKTFKKVQMTVTCKDQEIENITFLMFLCYIYLEMKMIFVSFTKAKLPNANFSSWNASKYMI